ncbi:MAG TPA: hypothetical protein VF920_14870 [Dongiaceae bacterium]
MRTPSLVTLAVFATASFLSGCGGMMPSTAGEDAPTMTMNSSAGAILTDHRGMTLYTYDPDQTGLSACTGLCAAAWPPVFARPSATATGHLSVIARADGSPQWALDGKPLYTYQADKKPGDIKGDGVDGVWHLVRPE